MRRHLAICGMCVLAVTATWTVCGGHTVDDLSKKASWSQPGAEEVWTRIAQWLSTISAKDEVIRQAENAFRADAGSAGDDRLLDRTVAALAAADPRAAEVWKSCSTASTGAPPQFAWLIGNEKADFLVDNVRLYYGRWLVQHAHFDEALELLNGLEAPRVVDPAALYFNLAIAEHRMLKKDECLKSLAKLMENEAKLPRRYRTLAQLMEADIKPLEPDSLDEVARLMEDIRRRLDFGHAGKKVRKQEDDVVAKLDKMIDEMEKQRKRRQQQQQEQGKGDGKKKKKDGQRSGDPKGADESRDLPGSGPGDVDQKNIGHKSGWGNLPPKEREEALQQISKDLPAHFREVIEEYFRKLARAGEE